MEANKFNNLRLAGSVAGAPTTHPPVDSPELFDINNKKETVWLPTHVSTAASKERFSAASVVEISDRFDLGLIREFEVLVLQKKLARGEGGKREVAVFSRWKKAIRIIGTVPTTADEWGFNEELFYNSFAEDRIAPSYLEKILHLINLFGAFVCRREKKLYTPVASPKGFQKQRIIDAFDSSGKRSYKSAPLTLSQLNKAKPLLSEKKWNWLYISLFLGLRPSEFASLRSKELHRVEIVEAEAVLWLYQGKLKQIGKEDRWKQIALLEKEQQDCLRLIEEQNFEEPSLRELHRALGKQMHKYAGRKGFVLMLLNRGYDMDDISRAMGHKNILTTELKYIRQESLRSNQIRLLIKRRKDR